MARSLSYWEKRKAREAYEMYEEVERAALELNKIYASVSDQIERDARRIFRRFETKFGLSEREAEKLLNTVLDPKDIKTITGLLRRDPKNKELVAQLESQAYASRINRLAKMQDRVDEISTQILGKAEPAFDATLSEVARGSYYREIFGMQQRANAAFAFSPLTVDRISKVLAANWSGKSYSKRLWDNTEALSASVKRELMKGLLMGKSPFRMSRTIEEEFHKGATASRRLMRTEATYVANQMAMEAYKEAGTEKYIYVAILDMRTSEICQSLDKKRFLISSAEVGKNYPPMHPWCRSTTIAWMPDELLKALKQSAVDPATGERIEVPGDMTYQEWYNTYGENSNPSAAVIKRTAKRTSSSKKKKAGNTPVVDNSERYEDVTELLQTNMDTNDPDTEDAQSYIAPDGTEYEVDGINVILDLEEHEKDTGRMLSSMMGTHVEYCPRVTGKYRDVSTPDYILGDGIKWDKKRPEGSGKDAIRDRVKDCAEQASNFIIDISKWKGDRDNAIEQAEALFRWPNTEFIEQVIVIDGNDLVKGMKRK